jgi:SAM-dependent methyltransferase
MCALDEIYAAEDFARLYDHFNGWGASDDFYLDLALKAGGPVLDLGCGTGMLACRIAAEGLTVVGVEPSRSMLAIARARPGAELVDWVRSGAESLRLAQRFDLVYMTGHAFQSLLTDEHALAVLKTVRLHLTRGGRFAFETRNSAARAWLAWTPASSRRLVHAQGQGRIEETVEAVYEAASGIVFLRHRYRFIDQGIEREGASRIRFVDQAHLARLIAEAGLAPVAFYGDWDGTPWTSQSREIIAVTEAAWSAS